MNEMTTTDKKTGYKHTTTDDLEIYRFLTGVFTNRERGGHEYRLKWHERYDGFRYLTVYVSNGVRIDIKYKQY